jgi:hypothetical protein
MDRKLYKTHMQRAIHEQPNLVVRAGSVFDLVFDHSHPLAPNQWGKISGVQLGSEFSVVSILSLIVCCRIWRDYWLLPGCSLHRNLSFRRDSHWAQAVSRWKDKRSAFTRAIRFSELLRVQIRATSDRNPGQTRRENNRFHRNETSGRRSSTVSV